ncbi:MAG: hypothetical protein R6V14_02215 [Halanaerobiales bacterium]
MSNSTLKEEDRISRKLYNPLGLSLNLRPGIGADPASTHGKVGRRNVGT